MDTLTNTESNVVTDRTETIVYLGSAGVYQTLESFWDPERDYDLKQSVVIPV